MKIMIIDDEVLSLELFLEQLMTQKDVEYHFFKDNLDEIMSYIKHNRVEAAFIDIKMPNIDGLKLSKILLKENPDLKIVYITGLDITMEDLPKDIKPNCLGFLYKPYLENIFLKFMNEIKNKTLILKVKTFGSFSCFINDYPIIFSSTKSKELFALLIAYNGKDLSMNDAISQLWPDKELDKAKILYRDATRRLRKVFTDNNFNCIIFKKGLLILKKDNIECDYWEYLKGNNNDYDGEFLKSYDRSINYLHQLDNIYYSKKDK